MIDSHALLQQAEADLLQSSALGRVLQCGILYGLLRQAIKTYLAPEDPAAVDQATQNLMQTLFAKKALDDVLFRPALSLSSQPAQVSAVTAPPSAAPTVTDIRTLAQHLGLSAEEIDTLEKTAGMMTVDDPTPSVEQVTDDSIVQQEADEANPFVNVTGFGEPPFDFTSHREEDLTAVTS